MRKPGAETTKLGSSLGINLAAAAAVLAVAPMAARAEVVKPGESPGLGLMGKRVPDILKKAKTDPYAAPPAPACETIPKEIAALDAVLGPDADAPPQPQKRTDAAGHLITGAMRSMIPHRDVVRFITGASRADKARSDAAMAGWSRRGYLKGMEINLGCAEREAAGPVTAEAVVGDGLEATAAPTPATAPSTEDAAAKAPEQAPQPSPEPAPGALAPAEETAPSVAVQDSAPPTEATAAPVMVNALAPEEGGPTRTQAR